MRVPVIAGNWKMHKNTREARALARAVVAGVRYAEDRKVVLAPPFTALAAVAEEIRDSPLVLAAQNVHWEAKGAFTGEISLPMLEDLGCRMAIVGHSERRQLFGETDETVGRRVQAVMRSSLQAIVCVGETLEQREAGDFHDVIYHQLAGALDSLTPQTLLRIIFAYEPVWAIGTGRTASPETAQEVHRAIREWLANKFGGEAAKQVRILYGGSVKPDNIAELMDQPDIDGALVGGACLDAESFLAIVRYDRQSPAKAGN